MSYQRKHRMWTAAEIGKLKRFWPVMSKHGLLMEFAPRSWESIKTMAYENGFKRPRHLGGKRNWSKIAAEHQPVFVLPTTFPFRSNGHGHDESNGNVAHKPAQSPFTRSLPLLPLGAEVHCRHRPRNAKRSCFRGLDQYRQDRNASGNSRPRFRCAAKPGAPARDSHRNHAEGGHTQC